MAIVMVLASALLLIPFMLYALVSYWGGGYCPCAALIATALFLSRTWQIRAGMQYTSPYLGR